MRDTVGQNNKEAAVTAAFVMVVFVVAFAAAAALGAAQASTPIPAEVLQLTQLGPALALGGGAAVAAWPRPGS
ncbi:hypothetical protein ACU635_01860 [[Actinomadura] parvosata]|uniref:hypothetical protein n=1 Tax=[Actinomadura] parvosata TaxID=1955412 RepID=UPI00406C3637